MVKNDNEKKMIYEWGMAQHNKYQFTEVNKDWHSYFQEKQKNNYIREYSFNTVPELKNELKRLWRDEPYMDSVLQAVLVASMKNKLDDCKVFESYKENTREKTEKMPAFIYNF